MTTIDDSIFISKCTSSIEMMRQNDINETQIACILTEIRSAALSLMYGKILELMALNPPKHIPHGEMADMVNEIRPK